MVKGIDSNEFTCQKSNLNCLKCQSMSQENGTLSDKLQAIYVEAISNEECRNETPEYVDESHLCTMSRLGQGVCNVS